MDIPDISIQRGGILYPVPQLFTAVKADRRERWWISGRYFVYLRQDGETRTVRIGPFPTRMQANNVQREMIAWYARVYNVIIRTYEATERTKK